MNQCDGNLFTSVGNLAQWAKENRVPLSGTFELTPFCNFQCVMCYVRLTKEQAEQQGTLLRTADWIAIAKQAKEMGMLNLCLTGGEPFVHPDFWEIYSELNQMGFLITILSNGFLIDENAIQKFKEYGAPFCIKVTLYGTSDETYWHTCHCKDGFTKVSKAIQLLQDANIPVIMTSTIVKENLGDLQEMNHFANEHGIPIHHTISVVKSARGACNTVESSRLAPYDFAEDLTVEVLEKMKCSNSDSPFERCAGRGASVWTTWSGHVQLCGFMSRPYVLYSGNFAENWRMLNQKLDDLQNPKACKNCEWNIFCQRCPGRICAESGDPETVNDSLCHTAKRLYELYLDKLKGDKWK